nr:O-antigen polymerase [Pseudoalteromonas sp. SWXJZ94C]
MELIISKGVITPFSFLSFLYLSSILGSFFLFAEFSVPYKEYSITATIIFLLAFLIYMIPVSMLNLRKVDDIYCADDKAFFRIGWFLIVTNAFAIIYFIPIVYGVFSSADNIINLRAMVVSQESVSSGGLYLLFSYTTQFYPIMLVFFFYSYLKHPEKKWFNILMLLTSMSYIVNVLASVGRDGIVLWSMSFLFSYIIFKGFLDKEVRRRIKKYFLFLFLSFISFFILISLARFLKGGDYFSLFQSMLIYFSQQFGEFNRYATNIDANNMDFSKIFPILKYFKETDSVSLLDDHFGFLNTYGFSKYVFKTFIGSWYTHLGSIGLLLTVTFISALFSIFMYSFRTKTLSLGVVVVYTLYCQVILHGVFYYKLSYTVSNLYMLTVFLIFIFLHYRVFIKR